MFLKRCTWVKLGKSFLCLNIWNLVFFGKVSVLNLSLMKGCWRRKLSANKGIWVLFIVPTEWSLNIASSDYLSKISFADLIPLHDDTSSDTEAHVQSWNDDFSKEESSCRKNCRQRSHPFSLMGDALLDSRISLSDGSKLNHSAALRSGGVS